MIEKAVRVSLCVQEKITKGVCQRERATPIFEFPTHSTGGSTFLPEPIAEGNQTSTTSERGKRVQISPSCHRPIMTSSLLDGTLRHPACQRPVFPPARPPRAHTAFFLLPVESPCWPRMICRSLLRLENARRRDGATLCLLSSQLVVMHSSCWFDCSPFGNEWKGWKGVD